MQKELMEESPELPIQILGVNEIGRESGNEDVCEGRDLPWLQETEESPVWIPWEVTYRDVIILNHENEVAAVFNLTEHTLGDSASYAALRDLLIGAR